MHDNVERIPINKLNFEQLRERVQILQDRYDILIRRFPFFSDSDTIFEIDWANIRTPLIRGFVNEVKFIAQQNYENMKEAVDSDSPPPYDNKESLYIYDGLCYWFDANSEEWLSGAIFPDKTKIYYYKDLYWYWNGNEWKSTPDRNIVSVFDQTPAGFSLKGVMEVLTDTDGRLTISDSFIKMYPAGANDPKIQFGYDDSSDYNNPIVVFGIGSSTETVPIADIFTIDHEPGDAEDKRVVYLYDGLYWYWNVVDDIGVWVNTYDRNAIPGYPVRYGQGFMYKTAYAVIVGMVSGGGDPYTFEIRPNGDLAGFYINDGTGERRIATENNITDLQEQIDALWASI